MPFGVQRACNSAGWCLFRRMGTSPSARAMLCSTWPAQMGPHPMWAPREPDQDAADATGSPRPAGSPRTGGISNMDTDESPPAQVSLESAVGDVLRCSGGRVWVHWVDGRESAVLPRQLAVRPGRSLRRKLVATQEDIEVANETNSLHGTRRAGGVCASGATALGDSLVVAPSMLVHGCHGQTGVCSGIPSTGTSGTNSCIAWPYLLQEREDITLSRAQTHSTIASTSSSRKCSRFWFLAKQSQDSVSYDGMTNYLDV